MPKYENTRVVIGPKQPEKAAVSHTTHKVTSEVTPAAKEPERVKPEGISQKTWEEMEGGRKALEKHAARVVHPVDPSTDPNVVGQRLGNVFEPKGVIVDRTAKDDGDAVKVWKTEPSGRVQG